MKKSVLFTLIAIFLLNFYGSGSETWGEELKRTFNNNPIMAEVDGVPITLDDLKNVQMQEMLMELYQVEKKVLKQKAINVLVENHPELKNITIPQVTKENVIQFYNSAPGIKDSGSLEELEGRIRGFLEQSFREAYIDRLYSKGLQEGWVKEYIQKPNDHRLVAELGTAMLWFEEKEDVKRKVLLLEYSDFQCPFCKRVQETLRKLRSRFLNDVQFAYRHFPLPFHKEARSLAEAAECARDQGRFWEIQSLIYQKSAQVVVEDLLKTAEEAGVSNLKRFEECHSQGKYRKRVLTDWQIGSQMGIQATPTFIVGIYDAKKATVVGEMFSGAVREEKFVQMIEKYIGLSKVASVN